MAEKDHLPNETTKGGLPEEGSAYIKLCFIFYRLFGAKPVYNKQGKEDEGTWLVS